MVSRNSNRTRRSNLVPARMNDSELATLDSLAKALVVSRGEAIRTAVKETEKRARREAAREIPSAPAHAK